MDLLNGMPVFFAAFTGCAVGSVIPLIHTELLILGMATVLPDTAAIPLILLATMGTMVGKTALYYGGRGLIHLPIRKRDRIDRFIEQAEGRRGLADTVLFASAASGFPPFYVVTVASGAIRLPLVRFIMWGTVGRLIRFTAVVYAPHLIRGLIP
jgi:membrane protein YqaA with SNARE-associated domain